jgi:hypothetical protein
VRRRAAAFSLGRARDIAAGRRESLTTKARRWGECQAAERPVASRGHRSLCQRVDRCGSHLRCRKLKKPGASSQVRID